MSRLPVGYLRLTHIESTGSQFINTRYVPRSQHIKVRCVYQSPNIAGAVPFGGGERNAFFPALHQQNANVNPAFWVGATGPVCALAVVHGQKNTIVVEANNGTLTASVNGGEPVTGAYSGTISISFPATIFAQGLGTEAVTQFTSMLLEEFQLWDDEQLVRDYAPCISPSKRVGLYDTVDGIFYGNDGSGDFIAGDLVVDSDVVVPDKSLGMSFARRRMMAVKKEPKYVWAVYDLAYVRDDATATTGSFSAFLALQKMAASAYTANEGGFTLTGAVSTSLRTLQVGQFIVDIGTSSNSTATSGQYLYEVTGNSSGSYTMTVQYKRYGVKAAKGETELYRVESDTPDYPEDGEQDGLWYVLIEGEV